MRPEAADAKHSGDAADRRLATYRYPVAICNCKAFVAQLGRSGHIQPWWKHLRPAVE